MSDEGKKPVWPWIVALLIGLPVLYLASFGAACALAERDVLPTSVLDASVFRPCLDLVTDGPVVIRTPLTSFVECCGGAYALAEAIARKDFDLAPYHGVTGGLLSRRPWWRWRIR